MDKLRPALQYSEGRSTKWGGARLINCFAEKADGDKRDDFAVIPTPGLTQWANVGTGPIRGSHTVAGVAYAISGAELYSLNSSGVGTLRGAIAGTDMTPTADNGAELAIAANGTGYVWSGGVLYTPCPFSVSDVDYVDGYFIWTVLNSDQFFISALNDGLTYDPSDIATAEGAPDNLVGVIVDHRDVLLPGTGSMEIFYDSGAALFPFERQGNAFIERGCFDRDSLTKIDNSVNFVGNDRIVYRLEGYQPTRISTHAIEYEIRNVTYARGFTYTLEGHKFYGLNTDNGTWLFDMATGAWHQRQSFGLSNWRVTGAFSAYGLTLLTSGQDGKIYTPSQDVFTEAGAAILMDLYLPTIEAARARGTMAAFEVVCETGVGNGDIASPTVDLRYSDDGGNTWSNSNTRPLGTAGSFLTRAIWRKLGQFRQRQLWLRFADPCKRLAISYFATIR